MLSDPIAFNGVVTPTLSPLIPRTQTGNLITSLSMNPSVYAILPMEYRGSWFCSLRIGLGRRQQRN